MTLKIDTAGRVVLPKPIRDRLGLSPGADLELRETSEGILLSPKDRRSALEKNGNFLVYTGELPQGYDILKAIDDDRDDRARRAWGL